MKYLRILVLLLVSLPMSFDCWGQEDDFKSLKLVKVHDTEQSALNALYASYGYDPKEHPLKIMDDGNAIVFKNMQTGKQLHKLAKKPRVNTGPKEKFRHYEYQITSDGSILMLTEYRLGYQGDTTTTEYKHPLKRSLYNARGEKITDISKEHNTLLISPDRKYFFTVADAEERSKYICFYTIEGQLLNKYEINNFPSARYSTDGEYVVVSGTFKSKFYVFTKTGEHVMEHNYKDLPQLDHSLLKTFVSEYDNYILLSGRFDLTLYDCYGNFIWTYNEKPKRISPIDGGFYNEEQLFVFTSNLGRKVGERHWGITVMDITTGNKLDYLEVINDNTRPWYGKNIIIIKKRGQYHEYAFK